MNPILTATGITKQFNANETVLNDVSFSMYLNSFTSILGPSGSGKSTLLNICSGLLRSTSGDVYYNDLNITKCANKELNSWKRNDVGIIFQDYRLLTNLTVRENIEIGKSPLKGNLPLKELAESLDIHNILEKFPNQLSGGQRQRVSIARALIKKPQILFCDEATGALDEENSRNVVAILHNLKKQYELSILFITHNENIALTGDRIVRMKNGIITEDYKNDNPISAVEMVWG